MYIGVDYYPEQWPRERWDTDLDLMEELGINVIRLAEFSWGLLEPEEGHFDFSWLDEAVEKISARGFDIVLGTPTATPPAWLTQAYPEVLPVTKSGETISFGARRHYTVNSRKYQELSKHIVQAMAKRYGKHPNVIGWQTDNEYGHEKSDRSYGTEDERAFQAWLQEKYSSLDELNERFGTVFWSQTYTDWSQIPVPKTVYQEHNPSLLLEFDRFCAEAYTKYNRLQTDILRRHVEKRQFITHNFVYTGLAQDQNAIAEDLDFISFDNYPVWGGLAEPVAPAAIARQHHLCRGTKQGRTYWVMEELSGAQGWSQIGYLPRPGHLKLWTYQAIAHGAEAIVYFRWRAARFGTEQFCHGILDHDGVPRRKYQEVKEVIASLQDKEDLIHADYPAEAGLYHDPENEWAWQIQPQSDQFSYVGEVMRFFKPAFDLQVQTDIFRGQEDLSSYKVLIVPVYFLTKKDVNDRLRAFAENGGTIIFTYRTGVKDEDNIVTEETLPGAMRELCGVEVHEYDSLRAERTASIRGTGGALAGREGRSHVWCDFLEPLSAEVLAEYEDEWFDGRAAVTRNEYGNGRVYYIGTGLEEDMLEPLYASIFEEAGCRMQKQQPGIETVRRTSGTHEYLIVLNHDVSKERTVLLPEGRWTNAESGKEGTAEGQMALKPLESRIFVRDKE
ncbi:beta-galactosidase [Alkalicoccus urumqiensis]|uniref:Beta-galactosidase n=1 Tax=Alkalicoccus urumqiensis TaxID=1548213 RepID=A0A2P6ML42_ALKUR|nr:beta-galactosidase [Alkalicoccus urumqiensis]PRO67007.1 beta-galactosidase [Alkalicoccus urumqiensis]